MFSSRLEKIDYLKRLHVGEAYWMNVVPISPAELTSYSRARTKSGEKSILERRAEIWLSFGMSVGNIINLEGEHFFLAIKAMLADLEAWGKSGFSPKYRAGTGIGHLRVVEPACSLDYTAVVMATLNLLEDLYRKFDTAVATQEHRQIVEAADGQLWGTLIAPVLKDYNNVARSVVKLRLRSLDPIFDVEGMSMT